MAAGDTLIGRRLTVDPDGQTFDLPTEPGDYVGPVQTDRGPAVYFLKPNARDTDAHPYARSVQHIVSPPHTITEEPDGTLTISASIGDTTASRPDISDGWHGYLEHGVWREV